MLREAGFDESLLEFVRRGVRVLACAGARMTVADLCAEEADAKAEDWSARSALNFRYISRRLVAVFGQRPLLEVEATELEGWLISEFPNPVTRSNALATLRPAWWRIKYRRVRRDCGVEFPQQDMFRHTFASYHLCEFQDKGRIKAAMGHSRASDTLFVHYRAVATKAAAAYNHHHNMPGWPDLVKQFFYLATIKENQGSNSIWVKYPRIKRLANAFLFPTDAMQDTIMPLGYAHIPDCPSFGSIAAFGINHRAAMQIYCSDSGSEAKQAIQRKMIQLISSRSN